MSSLRWDTAAFLPAAARGLAAAVLGLWPVREGAGVRGWVVRDSTRGGAGGPVDSTRACPVPSP